jgi:hypothetical protein
VIRSLLLLVLAACSAPKQPGGSQASAPRPAPAVTTAVTIEITDHVKINGVAISGRPMVKDLIGVLGKPNRTWDEGGANKVHTWDKLGVVIYEPYDGRCISATFPFKPMEHSFSPATLFGGKLLLDGNPLHAKLTLDVVKKWPGATLPYGTGSTVFDRDDVHVFTQSEDGAAGTLDLVEISFWQRGDSSSPLDAGSANEQACRAGDGAMCVRVALAYQLRHLREARLRGEHRVRVHDARQRTCRGLRNREESDRGQGCVDEGVPARRPGRLRAREER